MRESIDLGVTTPPNEECAQVGSRDYDYHTHARKEGRALINQLRRTLGPSRLDQDCSSSPILMTLAPISPWSACMTWKTHSLRPMQSGVMSNVPRMGR